MFALLQMKLSGSNLVPRLSPCVNENHFSMLQVMENWAGLGNKANLDLDALYFSLRL